MPATEQVVRSWITGQIQQLQQKISLLQQLLAELPPPDPSPVKAPTQAKPSQAKPQRRPKSDSTAQEVVILALEAAGSQGLTSRELVEVAHLPLPTISSRLSLMARSGQVLHQSPKYFAIHSEQQDNHHSTQAV